MEITLVRELDAWSNAFRVAGRVSGGATGWLRRVRQASGLMAKVAAARVGVSESSLYRLENAERSGSIELRTLQRVAEGLGCDLIYGLAPKEGTYADRMAAREAERRSMRAASRRAWLDKAKERRLAVRQARWEKDQAYYREVSKIWMQRLPRALRRAVPKGVQQMPFWKEQMRRGLRKGLREQGIRLK